MVYNLSHGACNGDITSQGLMAVISFLLHFLISPTSGTSSVLFIKQGHRKNFHSLILHKILTSKITLYTCSVCVIFCLTEISVASEYLGRHLTCAVFINFIESGKPMCKTTLCWHKTIKSFACFH